MAKKKRKKSSARIGLSPGAMIYTGDQKVKQTSIELIDYDEKAFNVKKLKTIEEAVHFKDTPTVSWLNIVGLHDTELIQKVGKHFGIHSLVLEDILNTDQRPKIEIHDNYLFITLKMLTYDTSVNEVQNEQISFILGKHFVISFQERMGDVLQPVRNRIKNNLSRLRKFAPDYLVYALIDIIVDHYFYVLECIDEEITRLEDDVVYNPDQSQLQRIHQLKRELVTIRRNIWPVRDIASSLIREEYHLVNETTEPYIHDLHDHVLNITEMVESIPLSFLAGIYGMNFKYMPELGWHYSYFVLWGIILIAASFMLYYFKRKNWL
ncbi:MAG: magnesium and cobalt transport protein CorA [Calditrichaceae bacterium]